MSKSEVHSRSASVNKLNDDNSDSTYGNWGTPKVTATDILVHLKSSSSQHSRLSNRSRNGSNGYLAGSGMVASKPITPSRSISNIKKSDSINESVRFNEIVKTSVEHVGTPDSTKKSDNVSQGMPRSTTFAVKIGEKVEEEEEEQETSMESPTQVTLNENPTKPPGKKEYDEIATGLHWSMTHCHGSKQPGPLRAHSVSVIKNLFYIFGGDNTSTNQTFNDLYIFDANSHYWHKPKTYGISPPALRSHTSTVVENKIIIIGGGNGPNYYNDVYIFDVDKKTWSTVNPIGTKPPVRRGHSAIYNPKTNSIYVFGGGNGAQALNDVYVLNLDAASTDDMDIPVGNMYSTSSAGNQQPSSNIYTTTPSSNLYSTTPAIVHSTGSNLYATTGASTPESSHKHPLSHVPSTTGLIRGKSNKTPNSKESHPSAEAVKKPLVGSVLEWSYAFTTGDIPNPRGYHSAVLVGHDMIVFGGTDGATTYDDFHILNLDTYVWRKIELLNPHSEKSLETNLARFSFAGILVGHFFYVIGGNNGKGCTNAVSILNLLTLQWEDKKSYGNECLHGRLGHVGVFYDNRIFMHGGFNQDKIFAEMWILDLSAQSVSPKMGEFIVGSKYSGGVSYSTNMYNENFHFFDSGLKIQDADASKSRSSNLKNSYTNTPQDISSKDLKTENNGSK